MIYVVDLRHADKAHLYELLKTLPEGTLDLQDLKEEYEGRLDVVNKMNVRRLILFIRRNVLALFEHYKYEPFDDLTLQRYSTQIKELLQEIKSRRGVYDFVVDSSLEVNTPSMLEQRLKRIRITLQPRRSITYNIIDVYIPAS